MGGRGGSGRSSVSAAAAAKPQSIEDRILAIYDRLAPDPGDWVNLADIRDGLNDVDRDTVDKALRGLEQRSDVNVVPMANEKAIKERTRKGAINIGGQAKHYIAMRLD